MTNQDTTSIDEKINDRIGSYGIHDKTCGVKITYDLGNCDCQHLELKALISDQVAKARIDELQQLTQWIDNTAFGRYGIQDQIVDRLATLNGVKNK